MRDHLLFYVNGKRCQVRCDWAFRSLSDFLRSERQLTGTKVVCAEGDCGSCTVLLGRVRGQKIEYRPVTSCIQYLAQLDATHVVTVEGLLYDGQLNPVQEAMVAHHGAQCGYCTPGMVVSMCALFDRSSQPARHEVTRALVGNLCRCTGYDSILTAAAYVDFSQLKPLAKLYDESALVKELAPLTAESVLVSNGQRKICKPATFDEAVKFRAANPKCTILSGGTDLGVVWNKGKREIGSLMCIGDLTELKLLTLETASAKPTNGQPAPAAIVAGGGVTIAELETAALEHLPEFGRMLARFGSLPIKNAGTIGGNLANGSPIGDSMPGLFVLNAEIELAGPNGSRRVNVNQFYTGYRQTMMQPDELIARVRIPLPAAGDLFKIYKVSKRTDLDISTFMAAIWIRAQGEVIRAARIALGGVAATIVRLPQTEAWLSERRLSEETFREAGRIARSEVTPISDVRGSARYRSLLAENILGRFAHDVMAPASTA